VNALFVARQNSHSHKLKHTLHTSVVSPLTMSLPAVSGLLEAKNLTEDVIVGMEDISEVTAPASSDAVTDHAPPGDEAYTKVKFQSLREDDTFKCSVVGLEHVDLAKNPLLDRILGVIYGNAIGDSWGCKTEFLSKHDVPFIYPIPVDFMDVHRTKHSQRWRRGEWTDDTSQMLLILETLLETNRNAVASQQAKVVQTPGAAAAAGSSSSSTSSATPKLPSQPTKLPGSRVHLFARKLRYWARNGNAEIGETGGGRGLGGTTASIIFQPTFFNDPVQVATDVWREKFKRDAAPNGAIMRCSINGIYGFQDLNEVARRTIDFCTVTHVDPRCVASCLVVTFSIAQMLQGAACATREEVDVILERACDMALSTCTTFSPGNEANLSKDAAVRAEIRSYLRPTLAHLDLDEGWDPEEGVANKIGYTCFDPSTRFIRADGKITTAAQLEVGDMLLDEHGHPVPVTACARKFDVHMPPDDELGRPIPGISTVSPTKEWPLKDMYKFEMVDYNIDAGISSHSPLIVTEDHIMELICHWSVSVARPDPPQNMKISFMSVWHSESGLAPPRRAPKGVESWASKRYLTTPFTRTDDPQADKAKCVKWAWGKGIRCPVFWSPTARDFYTWLWWHHASWSAAQEGGTGQNAGRAFYDVASAFGMYQPSAVGMYIGQVPVAHGASYPNIEGNCSEVPPNAQRVVPMHFTGVNGFRDVVSSSIFGGNSRREDSLDWVHADGTVCRGGLVQELAWLVGYWIADGTAAEASISQSDHEGGDHTAAIRHVVDISRHVYIALGSPEGPWNGSSGTEGSHVDLVMRERWNVHGQPRENRKWTLYPGLSSSKGSWFRVLLEHLNLMKNKHFPQVLLSDSIIIRRKLLAGFIDGDGHLQKESNRTYSFGLKKDVQFVNGLRHLATGLGYCVSSTKYYATTAPATTHQIHANDSRINSNGKIEHECIQVQISGVPTDSRLSTAGDPHDVPVVMDYKRVLPGSVSERTYSWSCVPTRFSSPPRAKKLPPSCSYVAFRVGNETGSMKLLTDEGIVVHNCKTMGAATWAFRSQQDWASTMHALVLEAGDTDSNMSVAGALLGCRLGYSALPQLWLQSMPHKKWLDRKVVQFLKEVMHLI
jgi:ADP-ribosylglycohydrolase